MSIGKFRKSTSVFALLAAAASLPAPALAQSGANAAVEDDVIIVTAQRRAEAQVDVPITITNISSEALETANVQGLSDITKVTPALRFDATGGGFVQPSIRGIGTAVTTSGGGANVGIYVDGFYSPNPLAADFDLISVDSVQVLKGPQGTLFGRNTTGGAILVSTREPSTDGNFLEAKGSYGRYNSAELQSFANVAVSDRVAISVEGLYRRQDDWRTDLTSGKKVDSGENWSIRLGLKAELSDNVEVLLRYKHAQTDGPAGVVQSALVTSDFGLGAPFDGAIPGSFTTSPNAVVTGSIPEFFKSNSDILQGTIKVDLGFADLTSLSQYRSEKVNQSIDIDYSGLDIFQLGLPNINETWSQEILLSSKPGTALQWTAGLFYFQNSDGYITHIDNFGSTPDTRIRFGGSGTVVKSYAAFLDATYEVTPQLFVTAGVRYAYDKIDDAFFNTRFLSPVIVNDDLTPFIFPDGSTYSAPNGRVYIRDINPAAVSTVNDDRITPRFVLRYKPNDDMSLYASFTKGYKAAILDVGGSCQNPPFVCNNVRPETINAYEVGMKYDAGGLSAEVSGFYYDYKDLQVSIYEAGTANIVNAASSEIYGIEGQFSYRVSPEFKLMAGASYVHARYKHFENAPIYTRCSDLDAGTQAVCAANGLTYLVLGQDLDNVSMQRTPEFTGFLGGRYETEVGGGELALSGNLYYTSSFFFGPSGIQFKQDGYETLSLRAQWTDPSDMYYVALWGDNVTNSRYLREATFSNFGIGANWNRPATYGIELGIKLGK
ncbi:MAG: TonB-dependent receptor [Novosphingobium sp.]|nr:TonB-dependent receptor [Novosphingobium sp.]